MCDVGQYWQGLVIVAAVALTLGLLGFILAVLAWLA